jgi:hypothetical protein
LLCIKKEKIKIMKRKFIILFIFIVLTFFVFAIWQTAFIYKKIKVKNPKYNINQILQKEGNILKNGYLAEILDLSIDDKKNKDKNKNIYLFDKKEALKKLEKNPFIKKAFIKKIKPSSIYIDYILREPIALIEDFKNIAVDKDRYIFPLKPFLEKKDLPRIYLEEKDLLEKKDVFENPVNNKKMDLALHILKFCDFDIKRIDVSSAFLKSLGKREIVLKIENAILVSTEENKNVKFIFPIFLRLNKKKYKEQLANYVFLNKKMIKDYKRQIKFMKNAPKVIRFSAKCIDMRIPNLAFIDEK